jgi:hypothetical protein
MSLPLRLRRTRLTANQGSLLSQQGNWTGIPGLETVKVNSPRRGDLPGGFLDRARPLHQASAKHQRCFLAKVIGDRSRSFQNTGFPGGAGRGQKVREDVIACLVPIHQLASPPPRGVLPGLC